MLSGTGRFKPIHRVKTSRPVNECITQMRFRSSDILFDLKASDDKLTFAPKCRIMLMSQLPDSCGHFAFVTSRLNFDSRGRKKRLPVRRLKDPVAS